MSTTMAIIVLVAMLALNAFFVAAEFAMVSARRDQVEPMALAGRHGAKYALRGIEDVSVQLAATQLGITACSLIIGSVGEPAIASLIEAPFRSLGVPESLVHPIALVIALLIVTFLHMVLGEMVPKWLALAGPERTVLALAPLNTIFGAVFRPVIWAVDLFASAVLRLLGLRRMYEHGAAHTATEFVSMLDASREGGMLEESEHSLLAGALDFRSRVADAVMVPRDRVVYVNRRMTVGSIERIAHQSGHSRLPVVGTGLDNVIGFLHVKDLLRLPLEARDEPVPLELIRRMLVVPGDRPLEDVLRAMRRARSHVALVRGPDGRTLGIVTLEDVLEALVGDIRDESDREIATRGATARHTPPHRSATRGVSSATAGRRKP